MSKQPVIRLHAKSGGNGSPPPPLAGLRFATYARKSNEDDRNEDNRSTGRQVEQARRYVEQRGGEVVPDHVYVDDAVSGAEFRARPGLLRFLDALRNGRPFTALVMSEQSRLGREQIETGYLLKQIRDAGVRVFYYLTDDEAKLDTALDKMMSSLTSFAGEIEREKARSRSRDASERRARQGHVAGGRCFGYENVRMKGDRPAEPGESHDYVLRRVTEDEAAIVRGIFRAYADTVGMVRIAKALNGDPQQADVSRKYFGGQRVPPPRGRADGWSATLIREMLWRPLYRGEVVWGKVTHVDRDGRAKVPVKRDEREWLRVPAEDLRIIDEALWAEVHDRLKVQAGIFLRDHRGKLWGRPDRRKEGRYLLSGLAKCSECGGRISVLGGVPRVYGCPTAGWKGVCTNGLTTRVVRADAAVLATLEREALTPAVFARAVEHAIRLVREDLAREPNRVEALERERATLGRKIERLVAAIGDGRGPKSLVTEIEKAEARVAEIEAERVRLTAGPALAACDLARLEAEAATHLRRFAALLKGEVPLARQLLKKLLVDRLTFTPVAFAKGKRTYAFSGELTYGAVIRELISVKNPR